MSKIRFGGRKTERERQRFAVGRLTARNGFAKLRMTSRGKGGEAGKTTRPGGLRLGCMSRPLLCAEIEVHCLATAEQRVLTKCAPTKAAWGWTSLRYSAVALRCAHAKSERQSRRDVYRVSRGRSHEKQYG